MSTTNDTPVRCHPSCITAKLAGEWKAYYMNNSAGPECAIEQHGIDLVFKINEPRPPPDGNRSDGFFISADTVVACHWRCQKGLIQDGGRKIVWEDSYWVKK